MHLVAILTEYFKTSDSFSSKCVRTLNTYLCDSQWNTMIRDNYLCRSASFSVCRVCASLTQ